MKVGVRHMVARDRQNINGIRLNVYGVNVSFKNDSLETVQLSPLEPTSKRPANFLHSRGAH